MTNRFLLSAALAASAPSSARELTNNEIFVRMIGPAAAMDSAVTAKVLRDGPGRKTFLDTDRDGRIDTCWFIDTDDRHEGKRAPLVVKVVDGDGDMERTGGGDLDSDLWVADWEGDGGVDRAIDYIDLDRDGDVDEEILYQWTEMKHIAGRAPFTLGGRAWFAAGLALGAAALSG